VANTVLAKICAFELMKNMAKGHGCIRLCMDMAE